MKDKPDTKKTGRPEKRKESVIDVAKYFNKRVVIKFQGGRELNGILKGHDQLLNLVIDQAEEFKRNPEDLSLLSETRKLGLVVCRGPAISIIFPEDGTQEIANPFIQDNDD